MKLKTCELGNIHLDANVDITDPCYDHDVWCRINNVKMVPGLYRAVAFKGTRRYKYDGHYHSDTRVFILGVYLDGNICEESEMEEIGEIGVDAGLAGIFNSPKPDYDDEEWKNFCDFISNRDAAILDYGVVSSSGYGDGCYSVYAKKNAAGEATAIEIRF